MNDAAWKDFIDGAHPADVAAPLAQSFRGLAEARATGSPFAVAQLGLSLDGRIATTTGDSRYINGSAALTHLHRLRALVDAVVVGAGTARIDNPRLSVRHCAGASPARVVIDPRGSVSAQSLVWTEDGARCVVFGGSDDLPSHVERVPVSHGAIPVPAIIDGLCELGLTRILVEGGADTLGRFLAAGAIDCLHLMYGRVIIGAGPVGINLPAVPQLSAAPRPTGSTHVFPDGDVLVSCDFTG